MANLVTKVINGPGNSTLTIPAGVTQIQINARQRKPGVIQSISNGFVDPTGAAYMWGLNASGQVGNGTLVSQTVPQLVLGGFSWAQVYIDANNQGSTFGINTLGTAYSWGANGNGNLGTGNQVQVSSPVLILGGLKFKQIKASNNNVSGIALNGTAYGWGVNSGALGDGTTAAKSSPVAVLGGLTWFDIVPQSFQGSVWNMGITSTGAAYAWGYNGFGNCGDGTIVAKSSPVPVLGGLTFKQVIGSGDGTGPTMWGLTTAGAAYGWGSNADGQIGDGTVVSKSSPVAVLGGLTFTKLYVTTVNGPTSVFGLTPAGVLYAWGNNANGQLGVGDVASRSSPVAVLGGLTWAKLVSQTVEQGVVGLTTAGVAYGWGINANGQLGVGNIIPRSSPVAVLGGFTWSDIACGNTQGQWFMGLTNGGLVYSWGYNGFGNLANGVAAGTNVSSPVLVVGGLVANVVDTITQNTIPVIPGTTYTIALGSYQALFGVVPLGYNIDQVTITFQQ